MPSSKPSSKLKSFSKQFAGLELLEKTPLWDGSSTFGLDVPSLVLSKLDNPQDKIKSIHVAGTNGKGTVSCQLSAVLSKAGYKVGQFCSPHLSHVTERCLINGKPVDIERFDAAICKTLSVASECEVNLSYFEITTIASFLCFLEHGLDWIVIEVGLGGRLDATNTLSSPIACVITSIGFDHMHQLGNSLAMIASEKAGISKKNIPMFVGDVADEAKSAINKAAADKNAKVEYLATDFRFDGETLHFDGGAFYYCQELLVKLKGYTLKNSFLSVRIAKYLGISDEVITKGLFSAFWPARLELLSYRGLSFLLDAAHNPEGVEALLSYLKTIAKNYSKIVFIISVVKTKDLREMASLFLAFKSWAVQEVGIEVKFLLTASSSERSFSPLELSAEFKEGQIYIDSKEALDAAILNADENTLTVICGSIFLLGELRQIFCDSEFLTITR